MQHSQEHKILQCQASPSLPACKNHTMLNLVSISNFISYIKSNCLFSSGNNACHRLLFRKLTYLVEIAVKFVNLFNLLKCCHNQFSPIKYYRQ